MNPINIELPSPLESSKIDSAELKTATLDSANKFIQAASYTESTTELSSDEEIGNIVSTALSIEQGTATRNGKSGDDAAARFIISSAQEKGILPSEIFEILQQSTSEEAFKGIKYAYASIVYFGDPIGEYLKGNKDKALSTLLDLNPDQAAVVINQYGKNGTDKEKAAAIDLMNDVLSFSPDEAAAIMSRQIAENPEAAAAIMSELIAEYPEAAAALYAALDAEDAGILAKNMYAQSDLPTDQLDSFIIEDLSNRTKDEGGLLLSQLTEDDANRILDGI